MNTLCSFRLSAVAIAAFAASAAWAGNFLALRAIPTDVIAIEKYNDLNGNGDRDAGEPLMEGFTFRVTVYNNRTEASGTVLSTTDVTTDSTGSVAITPTPGYYFKVEELGRSGWQQTEPANGGIYTGSGLVPVGGITYRFGNQSTATVQPTITIDKYYDVDGDGYTASDPAIPGWRFQVQVTDGSGTTTSDVYSPASMTVPLGASVTVTEYMSTGDLVHWAAAGLVANTQTIGADGYAFQFGNRAFTLGAGNSFGLGFWSSKNGQTALEGHDPDWRTLLNACSLRTARGDDFEVNTNGSFNGAYSGLKNWLLKATATNMSYMLSAQLAAMKLNVAYGGQNGDALIYAPGVPGANPYGLVSVDGLMTAADAYLADHPSVPAGDPARTLGETLKNALDAANNNMNFAIWITAVPPIPSFGANWSLLP